MLPYMWLFLGFSFPFPPDPHTKILTFGVSILVSYELGINPYHLKTNEYITHVCIFHFWILIMFKTLLSLYDINVEFIKY
jgi:hypothetical protein